jgi:hypothetical protein
MAERVHVRIEGDVPQVIAALTLLGLGLDAPPRREERYVVVGILKQAWDALSQERVQEALRLQGLSGVFEVIGGSRSGYV